MSTRRAGLTQYREWWSGKSVFVPGAKMQADLGYVRDMLPRHLFDERISSELLESVQVFNEPEITIGPVPHPDNDRCPDNCDSKLIHGLYRDDRDSGVYGEKYRKPLTATIPTGHYDKFSGFNLAEPVPTDGVSTGWKIGTPIADALLQECSNCHLKYLRLQDGLCEQCWLNPDFFKQDQPTDGKTYLFTPDEIVTFAGDIRAGLERDDKLPGREYPIPCKDECGALIKLSQNPSGLCDECAAERPMTLSKAVAVLNERKYQGLMWEKRNGVPYTQGQPFPFIVQCAYRRSDTPKRGQRQSYSEFEAIAIAEKLEREGK